MIDSYGHVFIIYRYVFETKVLLHIWNSPKQQIQ